MRNKVPQQPALERIKNFFEVALGYTEEQARQEAERCLECKNPFCVKGCPVEIDIPAFIKLIKEGRQKEALEKIKEKNNLPAVCGRVCPQEDQCEAACILNKKKIPINPVRNTKDIRDRNKISNGVNIGVLERYAADYELTHSQDSKRSTCLAGSPHGEAVGRLASRRSRGRALSAKIAVVGSGPAGLTCAADLAKIGYPVTLFESLHLPGGVLSYGIPEFRLPKKIVHSEVEYIKGLGVEIKVDTLIGNTYSTDDLFKQGFKAVFLAVGAGLPQFLGIPGENLDGVYSANEFLTRVNLMKAYLFPEYATPVRIGKRVIVIGGGNVAFDCARVAVRMGSEVSLIYRRTESQMPARRDEIENAKEEEVIFKELTQPVKILDNGKGFVKGIECIKMKLRSNDASGRPRPVPIQNSDFVIEADTVIVAIGQSPNPLVSKATPDLKVNKNGTLIVDKDFMTSVKGVFAGGDIITGADTVIAAMGAGKKAALAIDGYIKES